MRELTIGILALALFNTSAAVVNEKQLLRYGVVLYWILVTIYWFKRI